jgi:hypothetical protein
MSDGSCGGRRLGGLPGKEFKHSNDLIARNRGELFDKLVDGSTVRECIQQVFNRYSRAGEAGCAAEDFGV